MAKLKAGDRAPEFTATTDEGEKIRLKDLKGQRVILYFYPKDDTKGCTVQANLFRELHPDISRRNAVVLGVSPDGVESHRQFRTKYDLPFTLLADPDHKIAERYGTWGEKSMYGRKYMGIIRSHFVIDEKGRILDAQYKISPGKSADRALARLAGQD